MTPPTHTGTPGTETDPAAGSKAHEAHEAQQAPADAPEIIESAPAPGPTTRGRHLLSIGDLGPDGIEEVMRLTDSFVEVSSRAIPKVPALRGKTVVSLFFEDSTRTRLSFETAARRLSADVMTFAASS